MSNTVQGGPRAWAASAVQWDPARNGIKYGVHGYASLRGRWYQRTGKVPPIANIFTASSPKGGSQWMKALFDHPVVRRHTGLLTLPQLDYQQTPDRVFPAATYVPGLYCSYEEYVRMPKPFPHRVVYMFRDPRDLLVSGYYSAVNTHRKTHLQEIEDLRDRLRAMSFDDALLELIKSNEVRLLETASWASADDAAVATFRLEDVSADPRTEVPRILEHCGVSCSVDELEIVLNDVSRDSLQAKDLAQRPDGSESHYRVDRKTFRDVFQPQHYEAMDSILPGLARRMGYPD